jgi:septal ring factor EnvC (AmiA/AmiB activator)
MEKKIGCVQHDCDECKAREASTPESVATRPADVMPLPTGQLTDSVAFAKPVPNGVAELVEELYTYKHRLTHKAADALTSLQAQLEKQTKRKRFYRQAYIEACDEQAKSDKRIAELEAENARLWAWQEEATSVLETVLSHLKERKP